MTDRTQFEAMLEALINEDQETAKEIFHNIVVAKSREIYEELLAEDFGMEENLEVEPTGEPAEEPVETEAFGDEEDDEEGDDEEGDDVGGDATDDFIDDVSDDEEGDEGSMDDAEQSDRIMDLEDALEELKAEFEQLMAGDEGDDMGDMDSMDAEPEMGMGDEEEMEQMFEYVNKVALPKHGDNGANTKSIMAKKNSMGGTAGNIAQNFSTEKGGTQGGLANPKAGDLTSGLGTIHNRVDSKAGKTAFKKRETAKNGDNGDRGADSLINGVKSRAK